jgi:hypothetical protein
MASTPWGYLNRVVALHGPGAGVAVEEHKKAPECVIGGYALRSSIWANSPVIAAGFFCLNQLTCQYGRPLPPRITTFALLFRPPENRAGYGEATVQVTGSGSCPRHRPGAPACGREPPALAGFGDA